VTHVIRGEDHISNTPRQILIQEALGYERPAYAHIPLILAPDKTKMSKRHGAVAIKEYQAAGYLPEAIINFLALMGWNPGTNQELFTLTELTQLFSLEQVQKSGAIFNPQKFVWFNRQYVEKLTTEAFDSYVKDIPFIAELESTIYEKLRSTLRERTNTRAELLAAITSGEYDFLKSDLLYDTELLKWKNDSTLEAVVPRLQYIMTLLTSADFSSHETIKTALWDYAETTGKGEVLWPLRVALSGQERSPDPFTLAFILGQSTTIARIEAACDKIKGNATA
jgi:glutamyl/glutaminyl-tRNA synthetase